MVKIYFALGHQQLEDYIKSSKPLLEKQLQDTIQLRVRHCIGKES